MTVFIATMAENCSANAEAMGLNPVVEVYLQLIKLQ